MVISIDAVSNIMHISGYFAEFYLMRTVSKFLQYTGSLLRYLCSVLGGMFCKSKFSQHLISFFNQQVDFFIFFYRLIRIGAFVLLVILFIIFFTLFFVLFHVSVLSPYYILVIASAASLDLSHSSAVSVTCQQNRLPFICSAA